MPSFNREDAPETATTDVTDTRKRTRVERKGKGRQVVGEGRIETGNKWRNTTRRRRGKKEETSRSGLVSLEDRRWAAFRGIFPYRSLPLPLLFV
jgi:hypothetical protein